ncbi:hypothetical protein HYX19_01610 [Candidatus Woesearchaeota archaeon]|nr:hypothetical protein [Candidatus Woesearchaeota archaeon]
MHKLSTAEKKARELKALGKEREIAELTANQNNLRYMVHLATTENGMKKPEVFEDLFKKLGVSYFKQQGTREQRYDFYARQFEDFVIEPYGELTSNEILSINEVLMDYFSSADRKEFLNHLGFNGNFGP